MMIKFLFFVFLIVGGANYDKNGALAFVINQQHYRQCTGRTASSSSSFSATQLWAGSGLDPSRMRVSEIKAELKERQVSFADCFDKESLAAKLIWARENPAPPKPKQQQRQPSRPSPQQRTAKPSPPPRQNIEFGAESDMDSDIDMDVFKQAGWEPEAKKGMSPVDHDRSPGLNRNFDEIPTDDFKKPYFG